jgi:hypothetical protein
MGGGAGGDILNLSNDNLMLAKQKPGTGSTFNNWDIISPRSATFALLAYYPSIPDFLLTEYVLAPPIKDIIAPVSASCQKQPCFHLLSSQHESKSHSFAPVIIPTLFHKFFLCRRENCV